MNKLRSSDAQSQSILVTGAGGFIGGVVLKYLQSKGYRVEPLQTDIRAPLPKTDIIIHCAGKKNDEPDSFEVNVIGAKNLLASGAKIINISTAASLLPQMGLYGRTKAEADKILKDQVTLKLSLVYGNGAILKTLINWVRLPIVPYYGKAVFRPIYVEDVAEVIEKAISWPPGVYGIAGPDAVTLPELIRKVAQVFYNKKVIVLPLPRFIARLQLTESNILGADQTVEFEQFYGRPLLEGLKETCRQMS